jgi:hypothetical protein
MGFDIYSSFVHSNNFDTAGFVLFKYPSNPAMHNKSGDKSKNLSNLFKVAILSLPAFSSALIILY